MSIDVKRFLVYVEEIAAEEPSYRLGGYGSDGTCDCIGLIIGGIRRAGGSWRGTRGSNYAARSEVDGLARIGSTDQLKVGEAVVKALAPGEEGYDAETISKKYASSPDKNDYYHVGVVLSVNPLRIRHMTTPKPKLDTKIGKWKYHGWLKKIGTDENGGGDYMSENGELVVIRGGNLETTVNLRAGPSTDRRIIADIAQGSVGTLIEIFDEKWSKVNVTCTEGRRVTGYVQNVFINRMDGSTPAEPEPDPPSNESDYVTVRKEELQRIYDTIGDWLGLRG